MIARYHMEGADNCFIEAPQNKEGLETLRKMRAYRPQFKYRRIKSVIQAYPEQTPIFKIIRRNETLPLTAR